MDNVTTDKTAIHLIVVFLLMFHLPFSILSSFILRDPMPIITFILEFYLPNISRKICISFIRYEV